MPLAEQVVAFPLVGGVDEDAHPRLCSRLLTMENCRQIQAGSIEKRYGTTCVGLYNARFGGGTPPACELLAAYRNELVRVGTGQVDSCVVIGSTDCVFKGRASEALVYRTQVTSGDTFTADADVAYGNGYTIYVCRSNAGAYGTGTASVVYFVLDANGTMVVPRTAVATAAATTLGECHVFVIGTTAIITWRSPDLKGRTLDLTTFALGSPVTFAVASGGEFAACALSDRLAVIWEDLDPGNAGIYIGTWTAALVVQTAATLVSTDQDVHAFAIAGRTAGTLYYGCSINPGLALALRAGTVNPATLATVVAPYTVDTLAVADLIYHLGITLTTAGTSAWYTWERVDYPGPLWIAYWTSVTNAGVVGSIRYSRQVSYRSRAFLAGGLLYAIVVNVHSTHGTMFLVHLYDNPTPTTTLGMRIVATIAPRQVPSPLSLASYFQGWSDVATVSSGRYAIGAVVTGSSAGSYVASLLDVRIGSTSPVAVEAGGLLVMSGGAPSAYDGRRVAELGMPWEPDSEIMTATAIAGSGLEEGVYQYSVVYEWRLDDGSVVRSLPSGLVSVTTTAANKKVTVSVTCLNVTNKQFFTDVVDTVSVVIYRTTVGGATFYRAGQLAINDMSLATVNVNDELTDVALATYPLLYSQGTTPALPSEIPPSAAHVAVAGTRVWLSGTDDDSIWLSNELVAGEAPTFSSALTIAPFEGGRVVGVAELDEKRVILKSGSLFYVVGDGPGIDGLNGSFSKPVRIPSVVGCSDARSIVTTPEGVLFLSQNGLARVNRDLTVTYVGKAVVDSVGAAGIAAATLVPDQDVVRCVVAGTARTVEYDSFHDGAWGTNTYADPAGGSPTIVGAAYCRGAWFYINSAGRLFKERKTDWLDESAGSTTYVVQRVRLRYVSLGDVQGFARVWYASLDGERKSAHDLTIKLYVDNDVSTTQTAAYLAAAIDAWPRYQPQVHVVQQECEGLSIEVYDATPTAPSTLTDGRGFLMFGVSAELGLEKPLRRVPAAQSR